MVIPQTVKDIFICFSVPVVQKHFNLAQVKRIRPVSALLKELCPAFAWPHSRRQVSPHRIRSSFNLSRKSL